MNVRDCLDRIHADVDPEPTLATLRTLTPRRLGDHAEACRYRQSSEESTFTQRVVTTRATPGGRITLTPECLTRHRGIGRERTETPIANDTEWRDALEEHFDLVLEHVSCSSDNS